MTLERSSKQEAYEFVEKRRKELAPERRDADGEDEERDQPGDWIPYMRYPDQSDSGGRRAFGSDDPSFRRGAFRRGGRGQDDDDGSTLDNSFYQQGSIRFAQSLFSLND